MVPGGGVNKKLDRWQQTAENFLFDHGTACRVYKAKFADHLRDWGFMIKSTHPSGRRNGS
nr:hypothetical protein [Rubripirellula obstinata]